MGDLAAIATTVSIKAERQALARKFQDADLDSPQLDARLLLGHVLSFDHAALERNRDCLLAAEQLRAVSALAARRLAGEPIARIIGHKEFWGLDLHLSPATFVPRPETETVVEAALASVRTTGRGRPLRIVDFGTGSGAILLALLSELPQAEGVGTDVAGAALVTARENAGRLGLAERATFVACHFGEPLRRSFDIVVANPPYIRTNDIATLPREVSEHDPRGALDGGADGLSAYRAIAGTLSRVLLASGTLVLELGAGQAAAVAEILARAGLNVSATLNDLAGIPRALVARF